jgi:hypothetical protein
MYAGYTHLLVYNVCFQFKSSNRFGNSKYIVIQLDTILSSQLGYLHSFVVQLSCMYILSANSYVHLEIALIKS